MTYHKLTRVIILLLMVKKDVTGTNTERCQNTFHRNANGTLNLTFNCTTNHKNGYCKIVEYGLDHSEQRCVYSMTSGHLSEITCHPTNFSLKIDDSLDQSETQCVLKIKNVNPPDIGVWTLQTRKVYGRWNTELLFDSNTLSDLLESHSSNDIIYGLVGGTVIIVAVILIVVLSVVNKKKLRKLEQLSLKPGLNEYTGDCSYWNAGGDFDTSNAPTALSTESCNMQANENETKVQVVQNPHYGVRNPYSKGVYAIKIIENNYYDKRAVM